jgi:hypothetical protein
MLIPIRADHVDFAMKALVGRWSNFVHTEVFLELSCDYAFLDHVCAVEGDYDAYLKRVISSAKRKLKKSPT